MPRIAAVHRVDPLDEVRAARNAVRRSPEWEALRRRIHTDAVVLADRLTFDFRPMLMQPSVLETAGRLLWRMIRPLDVSVLIGPGFGAAPLLFSIAMTALKEGRSLNVLMVRDKRKEHHMKKWVEGARPPPGSRAILIDDMMCFGSAVPLVERALAEENYPLAICAAAVFFDTWQPLGSRQISVSRCPVIPLFRRHDIGLTRDCFDAKPPLMKGGHPPFVARLLWWRFRLNTHSAYRLKSAPVIADSAVFAADDHCNVWRHDLSDGAIRWQYRSVTDRGKGIIQLLQFADASLVFGCYDGTVTRLDARSGKVIWRVRQDSSIHATPAIDVANRRVFVNTEQWNRGSPLGSLLALDWSTGRLVWRYRHRYWAPGSPCYCADDGIVVATCNDGTLACVDAASGERRWEFRTDGLARGRPVVANGRVYAATESGRLHCVSISSGTEEWTIRYGKGRMHLFPRVQSGCVYLLDGQRHLSAFDQDTGALRWISRLRSNGVWCPVSCGDYLVTLSQGGHLSVFDPRCELKVWEDAIGGIYRQPPAIAEGHLAAASNDDGLKVFKIDDFYLR